MQSSIATSTRLSPGLRSKSDLVPLNYNNYRRFFTSQILLLTVTLAARIISEGVNSASVSNELSLGLSLGNYVDSSKQAQLVQTTSVDSSGFMGKILQDDISGEFVLTENVIGMSKKLLEKFVIKEQLQNSLANDGTITKWLISNSQSGRISGHKQHPLMIKIAEELDFVMATYWSRFLPEIEQILTNRPANLVNSDLTHRCDRLDRLIELQKFSTKSSLYAMILDIFNTELYIHCYKRKLALVTMFKIKPSVILRQFVDIYLGLPWYKERDFTSGDHSAISESQKHALAEIENGVAVRFDLQASLARYGSLEQTAQLIFDSSSAFSLGTSNSAPMISKFKQDCQQHGAQLASLWSNFDQVAQVLSSSFNNLEEFNRKAKLIAPQLVYGSLCGQLAATTIS